MHTKRWRSHLKREIPEHPQQHDHRALLHVDVDHEVPA